MRIGPQRPINAEAVVAPDGYRVEALVTGLTFPSAISFGPGGELYLSEGGGVAGNVVGVPRVLRIDPDQSVNEIGRLDNPIVGLAYRNGELLIAEDGDAPRILRVTAEGELKVLVGGLPGGGDYGLSGLTLDRAGAVVFGLGTRTNSGVVGLDNVAHGWVARNPEWADVPGTDLEQSGVNYVTSHPTARGTARGTTGSYKPFGHRAENGETVRGQNLCGGAVYRVGGEGEPERIAWGFRNPVGLGLGPDGRLWTTEGGMEERGSRPIAGAPDSLWEVQIGGYYGWPDYAAGLPVTDARFRLPGHPQPRRLLGRSPRVSGTPAALLPVRGGVGRLDFGTSEAFGFAGEAFVALAGPWSTAAYLSDEESAGHRVVRVDTRSGAVRDFLTNRQPGPSSATNGGGLERPFDLRFDPSGEVLYVVDMGEVQLSRENGLEPYGGTGVVWRITRIRTMHSIPAVAGASDEATDEPTDGSEDDSPDYAADSPDYATDSPDYATDSPNEAEADEQPIGLEASAEILAAGSGLDLEPPASDWLSEAPSLDLVEIPDEVMEPETLPEVDAYPETPQEPVSPDEPDGYREPVDPPGEPETETPEAPETAPEQTEEVSETAESGPEKAEAHESEGGE